MPHGILDNQLPNSILGLQGATPANRPGSSPNSQLHAQGTAPSVVNAEASIYDLNGETPAKYLDNPPE